MTSKTIYLVYPNDGDNKELVGSIASPEHFAIFKARANLHMTLLPPLPKRQATGGFSKEALEEHQRLFSIWLQSHPDKVHGCWEKWYTLEETQPWTEITL